MIRVVSLVVVVASLVGPSSDELLENAKAALRNRRPDDAMKLVNKVLQEKPSNIEALQLRADIHETLEKYADAALDWTKVIELDKNDAQAYQQRGLVHFKMGKIKESIADFDQYIERVPNAKISHWQRGISYYYAGRYDDGRKQFEGYQDFDSNDVENAVWRFMCMARLDGVGIDKARKAILKIGNDRRVPMRQVYDLYKGELQPNDVLAAAKAGNPDADALNRQLFYAHLYVGIYYELLGEKKTAFEHLNKAAQDHRVGHYMWDVARVHRDLLQKELKEKK
jgi:lipoprotein NlpI